MSNFFISILKKILLSKVIIFISGLALLPLYYYLGKMDDNKTEDNDVYPLH